jgi:hypothetical protein
MPTALDGRSQRLQWTGDLAQDLGGHLGIQGRGLKPLVPEQHLDDTDIHFLFQQMGGVAVTQGMRGDAFVDLRGVCGQVTDAVELPGAYRVDGVLPGEQPAAVEQLALGTASPPP